MLPAVTVLVTLPFVCVPNRKGKPPVRLTCWNGRPELFSTVSVAVLTPAVAGVNATLNEQDVPGERDGPHV